jgi:cobalt/nickel transport system permease protein
VGVQTLLSGKTELPFGTFVLLMQPIHLVIGVIEGIVTAGVINYVRSARPEILESIAAARPLTAGVSTKNIALSFLVMAMVAGGVLSWIASTHPDGLEWSIKKVTGKPELPDQEHGVTSVLKGVQEKTAFLPDYSYKPASGEPQGKNETRAWPGVQTGTSLAGIIGSVLVLALSAIIGMGIRAVRRRRA